jgi:uroporphyrinogen decarboxylase
MKEDIYMKDKIMDGIHGILPEDQTVPGARKLRATYARTPGIPLYRREFWLMGNTVEKWQKNEGMPKDVPFDRLFSLDPQGNYGLGQLGWCESQFFPIFEDKIIEDRGECEVVQDYAGRYVLFFKGRRSGYMPEYIDHPVKDWKTWEQNVKWRLNPGTPERIKTIADSIPKAISAAKEGYIITQNLIGGFMYLRSLIGPGELLFMFYDMPDLIHDCMKTWFNLADSVIERHQKHVTIDEIFFAEDICYNHGPLISPDMMKEFITPYYQQLVSNLKKRQIDKERHLYVQVDTDGFADPVIPVYMENKKCHSKQIFELQCDTLIIYSWVRPC